MGWKINGVRFTGTVATIGAGKNFTTINQAITGTSGDLLMLLEAGTYRGGVSPVSPIPIFVGNGHTGRKFYIKALNEDPNSVLIEPATPTDAVMCFYVTVNMFIEGAKLRSASKINGVQMNAAGIFPSLTIRKSEVDFSSIAFNTSYNGSRLEAGFTTDCKYNNRYYAPLVLQHNNINTGSCLISNWMSLAPHVPYNLANVELYKCVTNTITTINTTGSFAVLDYVAAAAAGYGPAFGQYLIKKSGLAVKEMHYGRMRCNT